MSEFDNVTKASPPPSGDAPQDERTMALIAHLLGIITWFVGALVIWLINKDANPAKSFATDQAKEALNFQITITIAFVVAFILAAITLGILFFLPGLVGIANLVFCIIGGVKANNGEAYRYPFALRLIK